MKPGSSAGKANENTTELRDRVIYQNFVVAETEVLVLNGGRLKIVVRRKVSKNCLQMRVALSVGLLMNGWEGFRFLIYTFSSLPRAPKNFGHSLFPRQKGLDHRVIESASA